MAEIKIGDLVSWEAGEKRHAGVVRKISEDGIATISRKTDSGETEVEIRTGRLEVITSTVEPAE